MKSVILLACFIAICGAAVTQFSSDVSVFSNEPAGYTGTTTGKIKWLTNNMRIDWDIGVSQVWDYSGDVVYKKCTDCESATMNDLQWRFVVDPTYNTATSTTKVINGVTCTQYNSKETGVVYVQTLYADPNGVPCQAVLKTKEGTKTFTFSNVDGSAVAASNFDVSSWKCPTKKCKLPVDVVVVVDKSGSISDSEWAQATTFVKNFAAGFGGFQTQAYYNANPKLAVRMGLVWFATTAVDKTTAYGSGAGGVTADKTTFNNAANSNRGGNGNTNIGDGIKHALAMAYQSPRDVDKIILFLTDGKNTNNAVPLSDQLARLKDYIGDKSRRLTSFSVGVGVGGDLDTNTLLALAGGVKENYVPVGKYSDLAGKIDEILSRTCPANTDSTCTCKGFCACGGNCLCPNSCPAGKCQTSVCRNGATGCEAPTTRSCTPSDKCHDAYCDSNLGTDGECTNKVKVCPGTLCATATCNPTTGCGLNPDLSLICSNYTEGCTSCDLSKPKGSQCSTNNACKCKKNQCDTTVRGCKYQSCNPLTGVCEDKAVECDDGNPCTIDSCDPNGSGVCEFKDRQCDDGDQCTTDTCDSATKDGCVYTPRNVTLECDDFSVCTNDTCIPDQGCVNTPIPCVNLNGTDPCVNTTCDPILGCLANPTDCYAANANISLLIGDCQTVQCNSTAGCYLQPIDGAIIDECGVCKGAERPFFCNKGAVAGIAVGVIAGATVGAVAGAAALGFGAKKGYDFLSAHAAASGGVQNNPMFVDNTNNNNPLFNG